MLNGNVAQVIKWILVLFQQRKPKPILFHDLHYLTFTVAAGIYNTAISISSFGHIIRYVRQSGKRRMEILFQTPL